MNPSVLVESVSYQWVNIDGNCNTNNHPSDLTPVQYNELLHLTRKSEWVKYFPDDPRSLCIELTGSRLKNLKSASLLGVFSGRVSDSTLEDLEPITDLISAHMKESNTQWFVRTDGCSPKDGVYNCGPFASSDAVEIIKSIVTSKRVHTSLEYGDDKIYLVPWKQNWSVDKEFRVFVHNRKVTAISQYRWHDFVGWDDDSVAHVGEKILEFCNYVISKVPFENCTIDVTWVDDKVDLVEFNCFGTELAAGSCCFHWINDHDILYGDGNNVVIRYVHE